MKKQQITKEKVLSTFGRSQDVGNRYKHLDNVVSE